MDSKEIIKATQTKIALDYFRKLCMGNENVLTDLVTEFDKETKGNKKMNAYIQLLQTAIEEVIGVQEDVGLDSLATPGGTTLISNALSGDDRLELISYLIIR